MSVMYESLSRPYDLESVRSRSVCLEKWKRSRMYSLSLQRGRELTLRLGPRHRLPPRLL